MTTQGSPDSESAPAMGGEFEFDLVMFDFGGVFTPSPFGLVETLAEVEADLLSARMEYMFGPYDQDTDHPWHRLERGETTLDSALDEIKRTAAVDGMEFDPMEVLGLFRMGGNVRDEVVDHVRRLRTCGYRTAIVTNNLHEARSMWQRMLPVEELFDLVVDSCEEGVRKPDTTIFERTLERMSTSAHRSVFLDDVRSNVAAAESLGIRSIHVGVDPTGALAELEALLGH